MKIIASVLLVIFHLSLSAQGDSDPRQKMHQQLSELKGQVNVKALSINDYESVRRIRKIYDHLNLDSALYYVSLELELSEKKEDPDLIAKARFSKANLHWRLQQPAEAYELLSRNLANKKVISDSVLAWTLFKLAKVEIQRQKPAES
ncbi:MAG: hypothetical protein AB8B56_19995, partial [Crocinitomicaceae bacterium]